MTIRYSAPGRINLIGEHTDYNLGFALPIALPDRTTVAFAPDDAGRIVVDSDRADVAVPISTDTVPGAVTGWAAYVAGVIWAMRDAGYHVPGGTMTITSDIAIGSGLSSSAALECAALGAIAAATGARIDPYQRARIAQRAENDYVGAPTGLLDQLASLFGRPATALLLDLRDVTVHDTAFDPDACGMRLLVIDSHAQHSHADGEYAARRAACERAAADLGAASLREVHHRGTAVLAGVSDPVDARRARHILTENQRVLDLAAVLADSDFPAAGAILTASHESMRDDFAITTGHIDSIVEAAVEAGALGVRMTGGGFGGCIIALVPAERAGAIGDAVRRSLRATGHVEPTVTPTYAAHGAGPD